MKDQEKQQQLLEEQIRHARKELQRPCPDLLFECSLGCLVGGLLGPALLIVLFFVDAYLNPHGEAGGPLAYLFLLLVSVPLGGIGCMVISPLLFKLFRAFKQK